MSIALWWFCSWGWTNPPEPPIEDNLYALEDSNNDEFYELEDWSWYLELE